VIQKRWWLLFVALAICACVVVGSREEHYQAQANQCRAAYKAQAQSERLSTPRLTVDQQASEDEAITAACEPISYFYGLFSAANLPTVLLLVVGIVGVLAAIWTLQQMEIQTEAIKRGVELQSIQWITLKNWQSRLSDHCMLNVEVDVLNETDFPFTLRGAVFQVGHDKRDADMETIVVPHAWHTVGFIHMIGEEERTDFLSGETTFGVRGAIRFEGIAEKKTQVFGGIIVASACSGTTFRSRSEYEQSAKEHYGDEKPNQATTGT
jgi:hypothetical protein